jgi:hypothetical protein
MGGSGGTFRRSPSEIAQTLRTEATTSAIAFETQLADEFNRLLAKFNTRNSAQIRERLDEIKDVLHGELEATFDTFFGGSVAKHTFVDGISDVDSMLVIAGKLAKEKPSKIIATLCKELQDALSDAKVEGGRVAVTVTYQDGTELQLVPTILKSNMQHVPAWEADTWSPIDPQQFREGLTKRNSECANKLIPTLKLVKAVNATLPDRLRLSGYHLESIGVSAFRNYQGEKTTVRMVPYFFERAVKLVLKPMVDRTGQSVHVDEALGPAGSEARRVLSHTLARVHQRMLNASAAGSRERWRDLLGE